MQHNRIPAGDPLIRSSLTSIDFVRLRQLLNMITGTNFGVCWILESIKRIKLFILFMQKNQPNPSVMLGSKYL